MNATHNADELEVIETLQKRYGVSIIGGEKNLRHLARDWLFLTTPDAESRADAIARAAVCAEIDVVEKEAA